MKLTEAQADYIRRRTEKRMGKWRDRQFNSDVIIKSYSCHCGHTEEYLIFGECPKCHEVINIKGHKYMKGKLTTLADEMNISHSWIGGILRGGEFSREQEENLYRILSITREELNGV